MGFLEKKVKHLRRRNSKSHILFLFIVLMVVFCLAFIARFYAITPIAMSDNSMSKTLKENTIHWMCKLPHCKADIAPGNLIWLQIKKGENSVRNLIATPGDSIEITDKGQVFTPHRNFKWKGEDAFIQSRKIYIPKAGDTLKFDSLNDVEQDYAISYLQKKGFSFSVKSSLWQGDKEINIERVGETKIGNRQVSLNEINFLPWQDRYLIEQQIRQSEPGNAPIKIKRKLFLKNKDIPEPTELQSDTIPNSKSEEPLEAIVFTDNCYYLICQKSTSCLDSRELGYFIQDDFLGKYLKGPDKFKEKFINPLIEYGKIIYHSIRELAK